MVGDGVQGSLVGRSEELDLLIGLLSDTSSIGGRAVLVVAEGGAGKTRLVTEAVAAAGLDRDRVATLVGGELTSDLPFAPLRQAFRVPGPTDDPAILRVRELVARFEDRTDDVARAELVGALAEVVERRTFDGPFVLVADDAQWLDEGTLTVLDVLARQLGSLPLRLVLIARPYPEPEALSTLRRTLTRSGRCQRLDLAPLTEQHARDVVAGVLGGPPGASLEPVVAGAGGNALYLTELALALDGHVSDRGDHVLELDDDDAAQLPVSAIEHNLHAVGADCRELLGTAALLGTIVDARHLAVLAERSVPAVLEQLAPALRVGVLAEGDDGLLRFRHDLVREAVYAAMPAAVRGARHREAVFALRAADLPPSAWVGHLRRADWTGHAGAWDLFEEAAVWLAARSLRGAAGLLDHAIASIDGDPPIRFASTQLERLIDIEDLPTMRRHAERLLAREPATLDLDAEEALRLARRMAQARWWAAGHHRDLPIHDWLIHLRDAGHASVQDIIDYDDAMLAFLAGDMDTSMALLEQVADRARARGDHGLVLMARYQVGHGAATFDDADLFRGELTWVVESGLASGERPWITVDTFVAMVCSAWIDAPDRTDLLDRVRPLAERIGRPSSTVMNMAVASVEMEAGDWDTAVARVDESVADDRVNTRLPVQGAPCVRALAGVGRFGDAEQLLAEMWFVPEPYANKLGDALSTALHEENAALLALLRGATDSFVAHARAAVASRLRLPTLRSASLTAAALAALVGDAELIATYREHARWDAEGVPAWTRDLMDALTGPEPVVDVATLAAPALRLHRFMVVDAVIARAAEPDDATRETLAAAHARARACGAAGWERRFARVMAAHGWRASGRRQATAAVGLDALTEAEQRVLPLIEAGLVYREIAEELHNSRRTIETHAAAIMRKLEVSSRRELVETLAARRG